MDSDTYQQPTMGHRRSGGERHHLADTRYPHSARQATAIAFEKHQDRFSDYEGRSGTGGRLRTAMLIVFAVVALSSIAAIGWMQYQSSRHEDRQFQISEPDRSVPALADTATR